MQADTELRAVLAQRLELGARHRVGDRAAGSGQGHAGTGDAGGRHVVVLGSDGQVGPAYLAVGRAQPVEGLRAGDLVDEVEVDIEQVGLAFRATHHVGVPDLLGERTAHHAHYFRLRLACRDGSIHSMNNSSGVGVLDKTISVLSALEDGPASLAQLVKVTGLARPTAHRIAVALESHRLLARDAQGRFVLGPRIGELAAAAGEDRLLAIAQPILIQLRDATGESAQLYRAHADTRICVAAAERASGLRDTVPVGAALPMTAGSAAQILLAWEDGSRMHRGLRGAKFTAATLAGVRRRGWAASAAER